MGCNELSSVAHYIIKQLTGGNLNNQNSVKEPKTAYGLQWNFVAPKDLEREICDCFFVYFSLSLFTTTVFPQRSPSL